MVSAKLPVVPRRRVARAATKLPVAESGKQALTDLRIAESAESAEQATTDWRGTSLESRPGFLIRRLHQIHVALFFEECAPEGITPVQYSILTALEQLGPSEQIALSRAVGLDRANTADVITRLVERRFIQRKVARSDKRKKVAELTEVGRALLARLEVGVARAHQRTIEKLPPAARDQFMQHLQLLVEAGNESSRTPVTRAKERETD